MNFLVIFLVDILRGIAGYVVEAMAVPTYCSELATSISTRSLRIESLLDLMQSTGDASSCLRVGLTVRKFGVWNSLKSLFPKACNKSNVISHSLKFAFDLTLHTLRICRTIHESLERLDSSNASAALGHILAPPDLLDDDYDYDESPFRELRGLMFSEGLGVEAALVGAFTTYWGNQNTNSNSSIAEDHGLNDEPSTCFDNSPEAESGVQRNSYRTSDDGLRYPSCGISPQYSPAYSSYRPPFPLLTARPRYPPPAELCRYPMSGRVRVLWVLGLASPLALLLATASWLRRHSFETDASLDRPGRLRRLLEACVEGRAALVAELLDADASLLDAEDGNGWTCLINASKSGHSELVRDLIRRGSSLAASSRHSALRGAALSGHIEVVRLLLRSGHETDALSAGRRTPLMGAAMNGHPEAARLLLLAGADPRLRNDENESALDLARLQGHASVVALIANATSDTHGI